MQWFEAFVDDTVRHYRQLVDQKKASVLEEVEKYLKEAQVSRTFAGFLGERFVEEKLKERGYVAKQTVGSLSPGDVWALKAIDDQLMHLPIIQVKNSVMGEQPKSLTREEQGELLDFTGFVFRAFRQSGHVPSDLKGKPLIVSAGYAGISMAGADFQTAKWSGCYYGAYRDRALEATWEQHRKWLHEVHSLGAEVK